MGPLQGIRIIELAGIGPGPFCGMLLADLGAEIISIERPGDGVREDAVCMRNRQSVCVDLKQSGGVDLVLDLCETADALYEGFRPGVAERLGLGPEQCMARNPGLVYGRITGWGQDGPMAQAAGHDINYISLSGALHAIGREGDRPVPPLNLAGDYGGGGLFLALGLLSALLEKSRSGLGQVVDTSMVEGSAALMAVFYGMYGQGLHSTDRGCNLLDTGAPYYEVYETQTGPGETREFISVGPLESKFYRLLVATVGGREADFFPQLERAEWPERKALLTSIFAQRTRQQWCELLEGTDACFAPVLSLAEAPQHHHNQARGTFVEVDGLTQPAPAPRFSRTESALPRPAARCGEHTVQVLEGLGYGDEKIAELHSSGAIRTFGSDD